MANGSAHRERLTCSNSNASPFMPESRLNHTAAARRSQASLKPCRSEHRAMDRNLRLISASSTTASAVPRSCGQPWSGCVIWSLLAASTGFTFTRPTAWPAIMRTRKTRAQPRAARPRPVRGGSEQPRRAHRPVDAPAAEWISVPVPAVVDPALFEAVQEQLAENRRRSRQSARGARFLLQGLLVCRLCGYAYYGKPVSLCAGKGKRRKYAYYRCCGSDAYRFGGQRVCANQQVRTDRLDEAVWQEVESVLRNPQSIAAEYERRLAAAQRSAANQARISPRSNCSLPSSG